MQLRKIISTVISKGLSRQKKAKKEDKLQKNKKMREKKKFKKLRLTAIVVHQAVYQATELCKRSKIRIKRNKRKAAVKDYFHSYF